MKKLKLVINNESKHSSKNSFFIRQELKTILDLYAKMVSNGSWRDYSLYLGQKEISFDVYVRNSEKPVLRIMKKFKPKSYNEKYLLKDGNGKVLLKSEDLIRLINKTSWNNLKVVK